MRTVKALLIGAALAAIASPALMETCPMPVVTEAVTEAIRLGAIGFDAIKLIALARIERRPARLDLSAYPHLPKMDVRTTAAADYTVLIPGQAT